MKCRIGLRQNPLVALQQDVAAGLECPLQAQFDRLTEVMLDGFTDLLLTKVDISE